MKLLISLITLMLTAQLSYGQFFEDSIAIDKDKKIPIKIDSYQTSFLVNPDIRNNRLVLGGLDELKVYKQKKLAFTLLGMDSTVMPNGDIKKVYQFKVAEIILSDVRLKNFPVDFEYVISRKNKKTKLVSSMKPEVGLGYLRLFSNAKIQGNLLKLEDIKCEFNADPAGCNPVTTRPPVANSRNNTGNTQTSGNQSGNTSQPQVTPGPQAVSQNTKVTVRIVPCSLTTDVTQIKSQVRNLFAGANITIEEEMNVPPPAKALARVSDGITLRYFATDDKVLAQNYTDKLKTQISGFNISEENMVPYFKNQIPSYFEVWIK